MLADAASSPARVYLFGSYARGGADDGSDVDFLVVEREVTDRFSEMVRLTTLLGRRQIPADVIVISEIQFRNWGEVAGTIVHDAIAEGRVLAESR